MIVIAKLSKAGLGNKMFIWAKALVFAKKYNASIYRTSWIDFHPKAYLRNILGKQLDWRFYGGIFKRQSIWKTFQMKYYELFSKKIYEPINEDEVKSNCVIIFYDYPRHPDFLNGFIKERDFIKEQLFKNLKKRVIKKFYKLDEPLISIHLRKGDLIQSLRTPNEDIIKIINFFYNRYKVYLPVYLFTDSPSSSVKDILSIPNVYLKHNFNAMIDLLHISKSRIIIPSVISSFSTWACFLSDAVILRHPKDSVRLPLREEVHLIDCRFANNFEIENPSVLKKIDEIVNNYLKINNEKIS